MFKIKTETEVFLVEHPVFIRKHKNGRYVLTDKDYAEGVSYRCIPYLFADGVQVYEVDTGDEFKAVWEDADTMKEQLQQADDTAIELYEAHMAQEEINTAQDDALIEIYERLEA